MCHACKTDTASVVLTAKTDTISVLITAESEAFTFLFEKVHLYFL